MRGSGRGPGKRGRAGGYRFQGQKAENREAVNYSGGNTGLDRTSEEACAEDNLGADGLLSGVTFSSLKWEFD